MNDERDESFGPVIDEALDRMAVELAAARAESDRLRRELESLREPPRRGARWVVRLGAGVAALVVVAVLLVSVGPRFLPYRTYVVRSGSMEPAIMTGDLVVLREVEAGEIEVGDIITFERPDRAGTSVTHRVQEIERRPTGRTFVTKGDHNDIPDSWRVRESESNWRYALRVPWLGAVFGVLGTFPARLALHALPAALVVSFVLVEVRRSRPRLMRRAGRTRHDASG